jgi:hypothetical protein
LKVVLSALHFAYIRNFESVVRELAERGHQVHLSAEEPERLGGQALVERLADQYPNVTWGWVSSPTGEPWFAAASRLRVGLDYVRFLDARYESATKLRTRYRERASRLVLGLVASCGPRLTRAALMRIERLMPRGAAIEDDLRRLSPDVLLLASLTYSRSWQMDQLKSAQALGIPVGACVASWDHLSSKALVHVHPDLVLVWNDVQRREAVDLHGLPADRVVATGAQCYDQWFDRQPSRSRQEFCARAGLRPDRPFVLYVCSALSPSPDPLEPHFVRRWAEALRADPALRDVGVLVRPHPERVKEWDGVSLGDIDHVVVHGANPIDADAKRDYFDALHYSAAVVGIVTSAFLEAAIVGRPVLTILVPEYRAHQEAMVHFQYLRQVEGGILHAAPSIPRHLDDLRAALAQEGRDERNRRFLQAFVRPQGLDAASTPRFVEAVEQLAARGRVRAGAGMFPAASTEAAPSGAPSGATSRAPSGAPSRTPVRALSGLVGAIAALGATTTAGQWLLKDKREIASLAAERAKTGERAARLDARAADKRRRMIAWRRLKLKNLIKEKLGIGAAGG